MVILTEDIVDPGEADKEVFGKNVQHLTAYLYADYGLLTSTSLERLQQSFDTLTELFDRLVLRTNVSKTISIYCQNCRALGVTLWRPTASGLWGTVTPTGSISSRSSDAPGATWNW